MEEKVKIDKGALWIHPTEELKGIYGWLSRKYKQSTYLIDKELGSFVSIHIPCRHTNGQW